MGLDNNYVFKLTTACPGRCACCAGRRNQFQNSGKCGTFSKRAFETVCEKIAQNGREYICLSGGEPTVLPDLDDYIKIAHSLGLTTRLNSNGWGLTEENILRWLSAGLDQIVLSLYSLEREKVAKVRGNPLIYDNSLRALHAIRKLKLQHNFVFILQTVIQRDTFEELPALLKTAIDANADRFWPSYLEDAIHLPDIRMRWQDIERFRQQTVLQMVQVITDSSLSDRKKAELENAVRQYYLDPFADYIYHPDDYVCPLRSRHFTFYPSGVVDPCVGHEYFTSNEQLTVDYTDPNSVSRLFDTVQNIPPAAYPYCRYCPQGVHRELIIAENAQHEHKGRP